MTTDTINIVKEYRKKEAINYSSLSALAISPQAYIARDDIGDIPAFRKGSAVDCLLTTPNDFHIEFYVMAIKKAPPPQMVKYVEKLFELGDEVQAGVDPHEAAYIESGYKSKPEFIREKYENEGKAYYDALKDARGKTILTYLEYEQIQRAVNSVKEGDFTKQYFGRSKAGIDILYQYPIYWETEGHACKSLLDILVIDHKNKEIFPIDLKTTGKSVLNFGTAFIRWKYYLQAAFYTAATIFWKNNDTDLVDYSVKNFKFLVVETVGVNPPMLFKCSDRDLEVGENGGKDQFGNQIKGYKNLISDLDYHDRTGNWDFPREVYENNGIVMLDTMKNGVRENEEN